MVQPAPPPIPLLLLPGLLCDAALWQAQLAGLAGLADCTVADLTLDDSLAAMADRALAAMPPHFALAGLSMGGYVAFEILRRAPARILGAMLMDTSARPDAPDQARRRRGLMALTRRSSEGAGATFRGVTPRLLPQLIHPSRLDDAALTGVVTGMANRVGAQAFLRQQAAILGRPDSRPDLPRLRPPAGLRVVVGADDVLTPPDMAEEIAAAPGAVLTRIDQCGHLPPLERPQATTALMRAWLQDVIAQTQFWAK